MFFNLCKSSFLYLRYVINLFSAIKRTQLGGGLKLKHKFLGNYKVVKIKPHYRYDVAKVGSHEGPASTSASADHMKSWSDAVATYMRDIPNFIFKYLFVFFFFICIFQCSRDLTCRWPSDVGIVPVTARWRSDSHTVTALCHSESRGRRERRSEE
ncbi:hypothetical protein AVEN_71516-1 [Araneus ventricosus]|uniref:Uncharacterized protein n=1 Tax=Araneus ventricosus TaxID=182803 RepID=A0A4Y2GUD1_ARAVE|nr:hypothetical protein AVEN_71516-1 [Araneus ventricosus]